MVADAGGNGDELHEELRVVEEDLARARRDLDALRDERSAPDALPDTADDAGLIRSFEDQEQIIITLEARRSALLSQLD